MRSIRPFANIAANTLWALSPIVSHSLIGLECDEEWTMKRSFTILHANDLHSRFAQ